jgi:hypothetical protein
MMTFTFKHYASTPSPLTSVIAVANAFYPRSAIASYRDITAIFTAGGKPQILRGIIKSTIILVVNLNARREDNVMV